METSSYSNTLDGEDIIIPSQNISAVGKLITAGVDSRVIELIRAELLKIGKERINTNDLISLIISYSSNFGIVVDPENISKKLGVKFNKSKVSHTIAGSSGEYNSLSNIDSTISSYVARLV